MELHDIVIFQSIVVSVHQCYEIHNIMSQGLLATITAVSKLTNFMGLDQTKKRKKANRCLSPHDLIYFVNRMEREYDRHVVLSMQGQWGILKNIKVIWFLITFSKNRYAQKPF